MITPEIRELQVFLALVRHGSFSAAAQHLGVTQPAVSARIVKLEQLVGFPLFHRGPDGTLITEHGRALVPLVEDILREYDDLLRRAAYWKRSQSRVVKIWTDGSQAVQELRNQGRMEHPEKVREAWQEMEPDMDWQAALRNLEVDIVLAGSFLRNGDCLGIKTLPMLQQAGITLAWNPTYYVFPDANVNLSDTIAFTCILPAPHLALGFRGFLNRWCHSLCGRGLDDAIECRNEADAVNSCRHGLGVMIFPGDADSRLKLRRSGLESVHTSEFLLPKAFTFGIRHRADEQNPQILAAVSRLASRNRLGN